MTSPTLNGVSVPPRTAIRTQVYEALRNAIFSGETAPGTRLVEARLADEIGVSRTPVREALHLLEREGLLESFPRAGYRVRKVSLDDVDEICKIRAANESLAVRWAVSRLTAEALQSLEVNIDRSEDELAGGRTDRFPELDAEFHETLVQASGSARLFELCQGLRRHMLLFRIESLYHPDTVRLAIEGHRRIVQSLRARDPEKAVSAVSEHLLDAKEGIKRWAFAERVKDKEIGE